MRESETIIQSARLRKAQKKDALAVRDRFFRERVNQIQKRAMMNGDRFLRAKIRQPSETEAQRSALFFRLFQMLMKALQRSNGETGRSNQPSLAHHLTLIRAVAVQRYEQWAGAFIPWC